MMREINNSYTRGGKTMKTMNEVLTNSIEEKYKVLMSLRAAKTLSEEDDKMLCKSLVSDLLICWLHNNGRCESITYEDMKALSIVYNEDIAKQFLKDQWLNEACLHAFEGIKLSEIYKSKDVEEFNGLNKLMSAANAPSAGFMNEPVTV